MSRKPRRWRTEGVVLRRRDWGEKDLLLVLYTQQGKQIVRAPGARHPRSRRGPHLQPLHRVAVLLAYGREHPVLVEAETLTAWLAFREDVNRYAWASLVAELTDRFVWEGEHYPGLYDLLLRTLDAVARHPQPDWPVRYYELHLLGRVGFRPELQRCIRCGARVQPVNQYFSFEEGGVVCPQCAAQEPEHLLAVDVRTLKYLRHLQRSGPEAMWRPVPEPALRRRLGTILQGYEQSILEKRLRAPRVLKQLDIYPRPPESESPDEEQR
ncbi:MAG: DNA repair protein RecO [Chloroflexi bacterium]|nr:DNA repair protein RecO [Chloroflexota bacterium]